MPSSRPSAPWHGLRFLILVIGAAGFVLLLLAAQAVGPYQRAIQSAALIWFFVFGLIRFGLDLTRR